MIAVRRKLRESQTEAEKMLWSRLRNRLFLGLKFRRQHSVGKFIADFCCPEWSLIIEVDGSQHSENERLDQQRTEYLQSQGYKVIRFWNNEILCSIDAVLEKIRMNLTTPHPDLSPKGERGKHESGG